MKRKIVSLMLAMLIALSGLTVCLADTGTMLVYFLDVGQGDSAIVMSGNECLMIDGGKPEESQFIYSYLTDTLALTHIDYIIATHPDSDHIGGLSAALKACSVGTIYSSTLDDNTKAFSSLVKYASERDRELVVPRTDDSFTLGDAVVEFIAPVMKYADDNNNSLVVRITLGSTSFLFMGDAESESESDMLQMGANLNATVLKVGHHGSSSSTSQRFLNAVNPEYAVISVGDNSYGHPTEETLDKLKKTGAKIYRTDLNGTIYCLSDGKNVYFTSDRELNDTEITTPEPTEETAKSNSITYIGNKSTKKFHYADCSSVDQMKEKNKVVLDSRDEAIDKGYVPCKKCKP